MIPNAASKTTGVAPLSVFFHADLVAGSVDASNKENYYYWEFDDSGAGTWADGSDKDFAIGACSSHVFDTAGTYSVTCKTYNSILVLIKTDTFVITVTDPDTVFATTDTICISDTTQADFTGKPVGALEITTDDLATALATYLGVGKRVLLNRGSSWTTTATISTPVADDAIYLGAYGTGTGEDARGIFDNAPNITTTNTTDFITVSSEANARIMELEFSGTTDPGASVIGGAQGLEGLLAYKIKTTGFDIPINWTHWRPSASWADPLNMSIVSCDLSGSYLYGVYIGSENLTFMGNRVDNVGGHSTRVWWMYKGVYEKNDIADSERSTTHLLKLHGPESSMVGDYAQSGATGLHSITQFGIVSSNIFGHSSSWTIAIAPESDHIDENLADIIFERNKILSEYGTTGTTLTQIALYVAGRYHTIRNNVIDLTGAASGVVGISLLKRGTELSPLGVTIYNNTIYRGDDGLSQVGDIIGVSVGVDAVGTFVRNNLASFPYATGFTTKVLDDSGVATISNNVLTDTPDLTDPDNVAVLDRDFSLTVSSSESIGGGYDVPVAEDFIGSLRKTPYDIGAYLYGSGGSLKPGTTFHKDDWTENNKYLFDAALASQATLESTTFGFSGPTPVAFSYDEYVTYCTGLSADFTCPVNKSFTKYPALLDAGQAGEWDDWCNA